jgi:hypothetical protein
MRGMTPGDRPGRTARFAGRTARFEARPSGGHRYAVIVEDVFDGTRWRKRVVRSYGRLTPESERIARLDAAIITARKALEAALALEAAT